MMYNVYNVHGVASVTVHLRASSPFRSARLHTPLFYDLVYIQRARARSRGMRDKCIK